MTSTRPFRDTKQRAAIKQVLVDEQRPLGPKELQALAATLVPNIGIATVYRNIKALVEQGELDVVEVPGRAPLYQLPQKGPSHFFVDTHSSRVYRLEERELSGPPPSPPSRFRVHDYQIFYFGVRDDSPVS